MGSAVRAVGLRALRRSAATPIAGERYGTLRRIVNRYNGEVNGYFLCDRGRFGYEFVNSERRIRAAAAAKARADFRRGGATRICATGSRTAERSGSARRAPRSKPTLPCARSWARTASTPAWPMTKHGWFGRMLEILRRGPVRTPIAARDRGVATLCSSWARM